MKRGILLLGSAGTGKTTLLELTLEAFKDRYHCAVIEGDVATNRDAVRLQKYDIPICLINTEGACHLEPMSIRKALDEFDLESTDIIFVENVGNLVCPAEFDIGEHAKVAIASVAEGRLRISRSHTLTPRNTGRLRETRFRTRGLRR